MLSTVHDFDPGVDFFNSRQQWLEEARMDQLETSDQEDGLQWGTGQPIACGPFVLIGGSCGKRSKQTAKEKTCLDVVLSNLLSLHFQHADL